MSLHDPFGHFKHKLWPKEMSGVKLAISFPTTKSRESPQFIHVQVTCDIPIEVFDKDYNFSIDLISMGGLHAKLWVPKVARVLVVGISRLPFGSPETK